MGKIILASASPRRRELLTQIGIEFEIMVSDKEERITAEDPAEICMHLAMQKALDVRDKLRMQGFETGVDRPTRSEEIKLDKGMPLISTVRRDKVRWRDFGRRRIYCNRRGYHRSP